MKKQVYKVGEECTCLLSRYPSVHDNDCMIFKAPYPLKPKKSKVTRGWKKKKESKLQVQIKQLEDRLGKLEKHLCSPVPQPMPHNPPYIPEQETYRCPRCRCPIGNLQVHYC